MKRVLQPLKDNVKTIGPALAISTSTIPFTQWAASNFSNSGLDIASAGYLGATTVGWGVFLYQNYKHNPQLYPNGFFSPEMMFTFTAAASADVFADALSYTPVYATLNSLMDPNEKPVLTGAVAGYGAAIPYYVVMSYFYEGAKKLGEKIKKPLSYVVNNHPNETIALLDMAIKYVS